MCLSLYIYILLFLSLQFILGHWINLAVNCENYCFIKTFVFDRVYFYVP